MLLKVTNPLILKFLLGKNLDRGSCYWQCIFFICTVRCGGLTLTSSWAPTQLLSHSLLSEMGKKIWRTKTRKLLDWDKNSLIGEAKLTHKQSKIRNLFFTSNSQADVQSSPGKQDFFTCKLLEKTNSPPFLLLSPNCYCWAQTHVVWSIPLVSMGQVSQPCPLPFFHTPNPLTRGREQEKNAM